MRQRVMIAMALALRPKLLIADEPTTAIDVTVQAQILELIQRLQQELHMALIMITHDLGVIAEIADRVIVMYAGRVMESADRESIYYQPHHPYTNGLLDSIPSSAKAKERLRPIPGQPPSLINVPTGCPFNPRCAYVMDRCRAELPPLRPVAGDQHFSACWLSPSLVGTDPEIDAKRAAEATIGQASAAGAGGRADG
jgi:oligopeptide/dipeptide ABC transporter ATP-binding protein